MHKELIARRKLLADALYEINIKLGITDEKAMYDVDGTYITNEKGEYVSLIGDTIMAYIDNKEVNYMFRQWLIANDFVIPIQKMTDEQARFLRVSPEKRMKIDSEKRESNLRKLNAKAHMECIHVVPKRVDEAKYYINYMDRSEIECTRAFNGNFTD